MSLRPVDIGEVWRKGKYYTLSPARTRSGAKPVSGSRQRSHGPEAAFLDPAVVAASCFRFMSFP